MSADTLQGGFADAPSAWRRLQGLQGSPRLKSMQRAGRERLDIFMPRLLAMAAEQDNPDLALERVLAAGDVSSEYQNPHYTLRGQMGSEPGRMVS